jgi:translocation and assembly module TamA
MLVAQEDEAPAEDDDAFAYEVQILGVEGDLLDLLDQVLETRRLIDRPPASYSRLRSRAEGDRPRLMQTLRARAYYDASVELNIDREQSPILITYRIEPGEVYRLRDIVIVVEPPTPGLDLPRTRKLGLEEDDRASSTRILDAEADLLRRVKNEGFALARLGDRRAVVDHDAAAMDVTYRIDPGPKVRFGAILVRGTKEVEARYVRRRVTWKEGQLITPARIDEARESLLATELFSTIRLELGDTPDEDGRLPVTIEVTERKHRSIEAGVRYRTDEGIGGNLGWEHRNLFGTGEQLIFELDGSQLGFNLSGRAREPDFLHRDQALVIGSDIAVERTDAFDSDSIGASVGIERSIGKGMEFAVGTAFRAVTVTQDGDEESFGLLSFPARYSWDFSNDLLNPVRGGRLNVQNQPFVDVFGNDLTFNKTLLGYTQYIHILKDPELVFAARTGLGFMFGAERDDIPADERFYSGGGGSVRGFGFQLAGELDEDNDPIGGRSLFELAGEIRTRFTERLGAAVFVDSGSAYASTFPDFEDDLRVGAGAGLRYFSPIGPLRFDVGFPLNRRDGDDPFQIYVSIGQAF